ncbi:MAG: hypothetical protein K2L34_06605 [Muribaculaceae bacterium]|nr:hypothetical protein [Muribaculaceae bacterium]
MKKLSLGLVAIAGLLLSSCELGVKDSTLKNNYFTYNLITPKDGGASDASASYYTFDLNLTQATGTIATTLLYNKAQYSFTSNEVAMKSANWANVFTGFKANVNNDVTLPLENTKMIQTVNIIYPYAVFQDPDNKENVFKLNGFYPNKEDNAVGGTPIDGVLYTTPSDFYYDSYGNTYWPNRISPVLVSQYEIGNDYSVRTFSCDNTYEGQTATSYPNMNGGSDSAFSKTIYYRTVLDVNKSKAYVVIYNAKFSNSPMEPMKAVIYLKDLDITWGNGGYSIHGTDIPSYVIDGNKLEVNPDFTFSEFAMNTVGYEMVSANISYRVLNSVNGRNVEYEGHFNGQCVNLPTSIN